MRTRDENSDGPAAPGGLAGGLAWGAAGLTLLLVGLAVGLVLAPPGRDVRPLPAVAGHVPSDTEEASRPTDRVAASWISGAGGWAGPGGGRAAGTREPPPHHPLAEGLRHRSDDAPARRPPETAAIGAPLPVRETVQGPADRRQRAFVAASAAAVAGTVAHAARGSADRVPGAAEVVPAALPAVPSPDIILPRRTPGDGRARIAIVIDDLGPAYAAAEAAIALPAPVTLAILPYADAAPALARQARANGHEIIVHLPMQPFDRHKYPGPRALRVEQAPATRLADLDWNLGRFDGYAGVNNHMGSRATSDPAVMREVLGEIARRGLYFLDSVTSESSVAAQIAGALGMPHASRDVFLDHRIDAAETRRRLAQLEAVARRRGTAIAIGHPHPSTLAVLREWLRQAPERGFQVVPLSELMAPGPIAARDSSRALR